MNDFFNKSLINEDPEIVKAINEEFYRQQNTIELIASENIVSRAVIQAQANILTNKYAEGYPGNRYYGGCQYVDKIEQIAINRAKELFNAKYVNVQPHSGSQANFAVFLSLLNPGDCVMGMSLNSGGHLTHGSRVSVSGKWFNSVSYDVNKETELLDYDEIRKMAIENKPKLIIAGYSAYSRIIDFAKFRDIAKEVGAYLLIDMAHIAGLVAGKVYDNPLDFADVVTSTTHKTLRGPRGGLILTNDKEIAKKINSAIFPGMQGGPLMHVIAAKAVAFKEALTDDFKIYAKNIITNTKAMCHVFINKGFKVISGGTDTHLFIVDLIGSEFNKNKNITGNIVANNLDEINITCNKNSIPFDSLPPKTTSGIRMGCAAITTRGMNVSDSENIANIIIRALINISNGNFNDDFKKVALSEVKQLCEKYPIYGGEVSIK